MSTPVTSAPRFTSLSLKQPSPQPTSRALLPTTIGSLRNWSISVSTRRRSSYQDIASAKPSPSLSWQYSW